MSLVPDENITYAPEFEAFAREISDEDTSRIESDPVARSTALRQGADLVEPDWLVVSGSDQVLAALPDRDGQGVEEYEFGEPAGAELDDLAEAVSILAELRSGPLVVSLPDPVTLVTDIFGDDWAALLRDDEFAALDTLHLASQVLTDTLREFEGNVDGLVLDASGLPDVMEDGLALADYLLELGPVFNLADHYDVSTLGHVPPAALDTHGQLREEFEYVVFESLPASELSALAEMSEPVGCSPPQELWESDSTEAFRERAEGYLDAAPDELLFAPQIPASVNPAFVQILCDVIEVRR